MGWLKSVLYSETIHLFHGCRVEAMPRLPLDFELRQAVPDDEPAMARSFPTVPFARRLATGDTPWVVVAGDRLIHQSWASTRRAFIPQVEYDRKLEPDEVYFYDCVTLPDFRGKGIYPAVLAHAARESGQKRAVLGILENNDPSLRGARRAGFVREFEHHYRMLLGFCWGFERRLRQSESTDV